MNCSSTNGRLDLSEPNIHTQFSLYDKIPVGKSCETFHDALVGNLIESNLSRAFFSEQNMQIIQNAIRSGVYKMSKQQYIIGNQKCDTLKIIMRSIFLQNSVNLPTDIPQQISALNNLVVDYSVKTIYSEAQAYLHYKKDVSTMHTPIDRPIQVDYDDKVLELKPWF
tara:strand:- start:23 stop:523 length:501 start_codon:yes stop_codon:yes gene_type:complete